MQLLFFSLILALFTIYFSIQNTVGVTIRLAGQTLGIFPLYGIVICSFLFGFFLAYVFSLNKRISSGKTMREEKKIMKQEEKEVIDLKKQLYQFEKENAHLQIIIDEYKKNENGVKKDISAA